MGRPTIFKKGAMTGAERQRRRRAKVRKERREGEQAAEAERESSAKRETERQEWAARNGRDPLPGTSGAADELARQIDEFLAENSTLTIADVRAAIDRRFGR